MTHTTFEPIKWEKLLKRIAEKSVIPIIGIEMYQFEQNGIITNTDAYLAQQLFGRFNVTEPAISTIAAAVEHLIENTKVSLKDITDTLIEFSKNLPFSLALIDKLLNIKAFSFYVNTAVYTKLLEKKIYEVRHQNAVSITYNLNCNFDDERDTSEILHVFNVFGSLQNGQAAITEEELLEYTLSFEERMKIHAPKIMDALKNKTLLFLGCTNPDWLMRSFMRVLSNQRMSDWKQRRSKIIVVNNESINREKQFRFLNKYNASTYLGSTGEFVNELADRWAKFPDKGELKKNVFISYTQKDEDAVRNLLNALSGFENLQFWYDKGKIFSDDYENKITENIKNADLFIPLISENSLGRPDLYVLKEWQVASVFDQIKSDKTRKYLMPIIIDKTEPTDLRIPRYFKGMTISELTNGNPDEDFINHLKQILNLG